MDQIPLPMLLQWPVYAGAVDEAKAIRQEEAQAEADAGARRQAARGR